VHSYKDLPTAVADGLTIAAVPPRGDPRDALVARDGLTLGELPHGSRVGTGSPRRAAQLRALGLGLEVVPVRGNVDTRLKYVIDGELDAVVLARAGLERLGRLDDVTEVIDPIQMLPAPAQGALAVECRRPTRTSETGRAGGPRNGGDDAITVKILTALDDPDTRASVEAERALLAALEAGCTAPVGALAEVAETDLSSAVDAADRDQAGHGRTMDQAEFSTEIYLRAVVVSADGTASIRMSKTGPSHDAVGLGRQLAAEMLAEGAATLLGPSLISERHP
jgi:hydroxymethylbilane synthase